MFSVNLRSRTAVYEQIISQVEEAVLKNGLAPNEKLPSVRSLSLTLTLNPNTVAKAYIELEKRGIIYSEHGRGCFVKEDAIQVLNKRYSENLGNFKNSIITYKSAGIEKSELIAIIDSVYAKGE